MFAPLEQNPEINFEVYKPVLFVCNIPVGLDVANSDSMNVLPTGKGVLIIEVKVIFEVILAVKRNELLILNFVRSIYPNTYVLQTYIVVGPNIRCLISFQCRACLYHTVYT